MSSVPDDALDAVDGGGVALGREPRAGGAVQPLDLGVAVVERVDQVCGGAAGLAAADRAAVEDDDAAPFAPRAWYATDRPAMPAPTTQTSTVASSDQRTSTGLDPERCPRWLCVHPCCAASPVLSGANRSDQLPLGACGIRMRIACHRGGTFPGLFLARTTAVAGPSCRFGRLPIRRCRRRLLRGDRCDKVSSSTWRFRRGVPSPLARARLGARCGHASDP